MAADPTSQAALLGVLQGLTEFLPVSSSAHLILLPWLMGWRAMGLTFDVMLHAGTLLAVLIYFRDMWKELTLQLLNRFRNPSAAFSLADALIVGTLPAVAAGLLFGRLIETHARAPAVTAGTLALFGLLLGWADRTGSRSRELGAIGWREAGIIGIAQALALVPGVSRSGATITAALLLGINRTDSVRFSFLLAGPILILAALRSALDLALVAEPAAAPGATPLVVGILFAFIAGFLCIKYLLRFVQVRSFFPFVVYRLLLAAFIWYWLAA